MRVGSKLPDWALAALLTGVTLLLVSSSGTSSGRKMSQAAVAQATATVAGPGPWRANDLMGFQVLAEFFEREGVEIWLCSLAGSFVVGLSGIFPLLIIPIEAGPTLKTEAGCQKLKRLLSFAIGGLLGDVFLHLLPEAWDHSSSVDGRLPHFRTQGLLVMMGMLSFLVLEKMFPDEGIQENPGRLNPPVSFTPSVYSRSGASESHVNGHCSVACQSSAEPKFSSHHQPEKIKTSGYLNLLANCIDNFTHGLAVAGSFLVSRKVGFLTTFAILLHEIPHEVGDFAILLRAGFDRWSAVRMQLSTALGGVLGACFALCAQSPKGAENATIWILPFTSGGFLYIALVNMVPDLLQEAKPRESLLQILLLCFGIAVMAFLSAIVD